MPSRYRDSGGRAGNRVWLLVQSLAVLSLSVLLVSCTPLRLQFPTKRVASDWNLDGRSPRRDRASIDIPVNLPINEIWVYNAGAGFSAGSPLIAADHVFVGTRNGEVHAVELETGERTGNQSFGNSIEGTPALLGQTLYVPNAWGGDALVAFDLARGRKQWKHRGVPIEASVLALDNLIVVGDVEGNIIAFDPADGTIQWLHEPAQVSAVLSGPVAVDGDRIVVANESGVVVCVRVSDGAELWTIDVGAPVEDSISSDGERAFIPTTRGAFHAINWKSGKTLWTYRVPDEKVRFTGPAIASGLLVFGGSDGVLRALDVEQGKVEWTFQTDGTFAAPPAISGQLVFVGAMDRKLFAVGMTEGSLQWSATLRGRVKSAPAVANGMVVVLSEPKYVYAFANADAVAGI